MKKVKELISSLLVVAMLLTAAPLSGLAELDIDFGLLDFNSRVSATDNELAPTGRCGENVYWNFDKDTGLLTISGSGEMYEYEEMIDAPFSKNKQIKNLVITDSVRNIGVYFLYDCENVESVTISDSVTIIGEWAFCKCTSLKTVLIGKGVTEIKKSAFAGCSSLENINLPNSLMFIGVDAFSESGISEITIPYNVEYIGDCAFEKCSNLTKVVIGNSVQSIASFSFYKCSNLKSIVIPVSVIRIDEAAFSYCDKLTNVFYCGSKDDWYDIAVEADNGYLHKVDISYNYYCPHTNHIWSNWTVDFSEGIYSGKKTRYCLERNELETTEFSVGDVFEFGSYPQSKVTDESVINSLKKLENENEWIDYNYYAGTDFWDDGKMQPVKGMMYYIDISYNGNKYRAVKIMQYRPNCTSNKSSSRNTYQDDNGYYTGNTYYFKYEPIVWRMLDPDSGFVMCNKIVDSQAYQNYICYNRLEKMHYNSKEYTNYASDWATSSLRQWLNEDFYNVAFCDTEKAQVGISNIENRNIASDTYNGTDTYDMIFLLSYYDSINSTYGFSDSNEESVSRILEVSDYAQCQGCPITLNQNLGLSWWWLRTPSESDDATWVYDNGSTGNTCSVNNTHLGIVPAFKLNSKISENHNYTSIVTNPTCTEQGYTTYTCSCGDRYVDNYVNALGHNYKAVVTAPTCTEQGFTTYTCSRCHDSYKSNYVSAKGHTDGEWKITKKPTLTREGERTLYCKDCGQVIKTETIPKLTHGKVNGVKIDDISLNYKKSTTLKPQIDADDGVKYTVKYSSSNAKVATVDKNGKVTATKRGSGSATITCTVTDSNGNTVTDTCKVNVKLSFGQILITYILFGWIWY